MAEVIFHHTDICHEICQYLPLIDVLLLIKYKIITYKVNIRKEVMKRLIELNYHRLFAENILDNIEKTGSLLSGSFMLGVMISPMGGKLSWMPEDLDVYSFSAVGHICDYCRRKYTASSKFTTFLCSQGMQLEKRCKYPELQIVTDFKAVSDDAVAINNILVDPEAHSLKEFVYNTFDFNFAKITYDGQHLSIHSPFSVLEKKCEYTGEKDVDRYYSLKAQLATAHDVFTKDTHQFNLVLSRIYKTYTQRRKKYEERGFKIDWKCPIGENLVQFYSVYRNNSLLKKLRRRFGPRYLGGGRRPQTWHITCDRRDATIATSQEELKTVLQSLPFSQCVTNNNYITILFNLDTSLLLHPEYK
jgi:hypothetical protein